MSEDSKVDPFAVDDDNPLWTAEDFARARPGGEVFAELGIEPPRPRGRPKSERPKVQVTLRLDAEVLEHFRARGPGWQTEVNRTLRGAAFKGLKRAAGGGKVVRDETSGRFVAAKRGDGAAMKTAAGSALTQRPEKGGRPLGKGKHHSGPAKGRKR